MISSQIRKLWHALFARPKRGRTRLAMPSEQFEVRCVPSNVNVFAGAGYIILIGDSPTANHDVLVTFDAGNSATITGLNGTTLNGMSSLSLTGTVPANTSICACFGSGADSLVLHSDGVDPVDFGHLYISMGEGPDNVAIENCRSGGATTIVLGCDTSANSVFVGANNQEEGFGYSVLPCLAIYGGAGTDTVDLADVDVSTALCMILGTGSSDTAYIGAFANRRNTIGHTAIIGCGPSQMIEIANTTFTQTVCLATYGAASTVQMTGTFRQTIFEKCYFAHTLGAGSSQLIAGSVQFSNLTMLVFGDSGTLDLNQETNSQISFSNRLYVHGCGPQPTNIVKHSPAGASLFYTPSLIFRHLTTGFAFP